MTLVPGGLYVFLTMRSDAGDCHWGLYLHHSTHTASIPNTNTLLSPKQRIVHRGKKYHVRNLGEGYMADHQVVGDMLSTLFLVGLVRIGVIHNDDLPVVDKVITSLDTQVPQLSRGNAIYCRTWVTGTTRALVQQGFLTTSATDGEVWAYIENFGREQWAGAAQAIQPRPIVESLLFL
jgi:hypothetical protein